MTTNLSMRLVAGAVLACALAPAHAAEDTYPTRPIRLVIPFTPGGGTDFIGRLIAQKLTESFKQTVVVENKPGAGGSLGTVDVARAPADGYTLLLATSSTHGINPSLYAKLDYDVQRDFAPITILAKTDYALSVPVTSPYKTVADLVKAGHDKPVQYASSGNGTTSHLAAALLGAQSKTPFVHVPYKSSGPALTDLIGGQTAFMFDNVSVMLPHAQGGRLHMLATTGKQRASSTPQVPTLAESGYPEYEMVGWWALVAPAKTPPAVVEKLNREVLKAMAMPEVRERIVAGGSEPYTLSPDESRRFIDGELKRYKVIVDLAGAKME